MSEVPRRALLRMMSIASRSFIASRTVRSENSVSLATLTCDGQEAPSDTALAQVYGTHSLGRVRRLIAYMEEQGIFVLRTDLSGKRSITIPRLGWTGRPEDVGLRPGGAPPRFGLFRIIAGHRAAAFELETPSGQLLSPRAAERESSREGGASLERVAQKWNRFCA